MVVVLLLFWSVLQLLVEDILEIDFCAAHREYDSALSMWSGIGNLGRARDTLV